MVSESAKVILAPSVMRKFRSVDGGILFVPIEYISVRHLPYSDGGQC